MLSRRPRSAARLVGPVLLALAAAVVALGALSIQAVSREAVVRKRLITDTHRGIADLLQARVQSELSRLDELIAAALDGAKDIQSLTPATNDLERTHPW